MIKELNYDSHVIRYNYYWLIMAACGKASYDYWSAA